ncbi:MAG: sn-glycerol-1-phosphate dehydrogenase [Chloroflexi bacterium HGW-Chloroflexi-1]|nr:MAG: sn-glycerol-1-phosphate dehydrogenase [Chloroflexi bacterium HGW-Chloroflexi-1]
MPTHFPVYIGPAAVDHLLAYCQNHRLSRFTLVADRNTYAALGEAVAAAQQAQGYDVLTGLLAGDEIIADARHVFQVLLAIDRVERTYLAVGSGTITDITRFVSHRTGAGFISLPTAPSVDGYTANGSPMVIDGVKVTAPGHAPLAVFADLPTLCAAPRPLIAAGVGDMLAKLTSSADWELGRLLWDEPFDAEIAARGRRAAWRCAQHVDEIAAGSETGIRALMEGLIESGFCMLDFGSSLPASGGEHHISHCWELKLLREGRPAILHGAKVGIAVLYGARRYDAIRALTCAAVASRLAQRALPDRAQQIAGIRQAYGPLADQVITIQAPFLDMTGADFARLKDKVGANWDQILRIAGTVPPAAEVEAWLRQVGGPVTGAEVGLDDAEVAVGVKYGHYYRNHFTIHKLSWLLGIA